ELGLMGWQGDNRRRRSRLLPLPSPTRAVRSSTGYGRNLSSLSTSTGSRDPVTLGGRAGESHACRFRVARKQPLIVGHDFDHEPRVLVTRRAIEPRAPAPAHHVATLELIQ